MLQSPYPGAAREQPRTPIVTPATSHFRCVSIHAAAAILFTTMLAACSSPPVVSGDLSCERFRHISATAQQIQLLSDHYDVMESWAIQIAEHNTEFDKDCLPKGRGK